LDLLKWSGEHRPRLSEKYVDDTNDRRAKYSPDAFVHDLQIIVQAIRKTKLSD